MSEAKSIEPYKLLSGKDIKCRLYKILLPSLVHNKYKYKVGLNTLEEKFEPSGDCTSGGLYATWEPWRFFHYGIFISEVTLPDDAQVWTMPHKLKADKLIIGKPVPIAEGKIDWMSAVSSQGRLIARMYHRDQTEELAIAAVRQTGLALAFVHKQTPQICRIAVEEHPLAILSVRDPDVFKQLQHVHPKGPHSKIRNMLPWEFAFEAIRQYMTPGTTLYGLHDDPKFLEFSQNKNPEQCLNAVKQSYCALLFIHKQTAELCSKAVQHGSALNFIQDQTPELLDTAIEKCRFVATTVATAKAPVPTLVDMIMKHYGICQ